MDHCCFILQKFDLRGKQIEAVEERASQEVQSIIIMTLFALLRCHPPTQNTVLNVLTVLTAVWKNTVYITVHVCALSQYIIYLSLCFLYCKEHPTLR